jgi:CRISPR-associated protein Csm5
MKTYRFRARALTPIHVGAGREIDPTQFVLRDGRLVRFNAADLLDALGPDELDRFREMLDKADIAAMQRFMASKIDGNGDGRQAIAVSSKFAREFETRAATPGRQFRVEMMPRNEHRGLAYLPGSGIKGAIRTAVVDHFANYDKGTRRLVHDRVRNAPTRKKAEVLEEAALGRRRSETERDVLRLVRVADVLLPEKATRIDRAVNVHPDKHGAEKIQMWVERVVSLADTANPPEFAVEISVDDRALGHPGVRAVLGRILDRDTMMVACSRFYWNRMLAEGDKFDRRGQGGKSWEAIHGLFPRGRTAEGQTLVLDPASPYWDSRKFLPRWMLLRVGRFSHFESLSVDELRQGYNVQARRSITGMGATRTRCAMENGRPPMPFGWLLLALDDDSGNSMGLTK